MLRTLSRLSFGIVAVIGLILVAMGDVRGAALIVAGVLLADLGLYYLRRGVAWVLRQGPKFDRW